MVQFFDSTCVHEEIPKEWKKDVSFYVVITFSFVLIFVINEEREVPLLGDYSKEWNVVYGSGPSGSKIINNISHFSCYLRYTLLCRSKINITKKSSNLWSRMKETILPSTDLEVSLFLDHPIYTYILYIFWILSTSDVKNW